MSWVCDVCGYVHEGNHPPDTCPHCGAPKESFYDSEDTELSSVLDKQPEDLSDD